VCGLVGVFALDARATCIEKPLLDTMRDTMVHRGPDGAGTWISPDRRLGLAHRRLAIIDPSVAANQPMTSVDGRFTVVFNGEIYNHGAIRSELTAIQPRQWQTDHSDTEVLLEAFAQWGIECISRFRGMFAFAMWDSLERELWLVRDRIGIKPMYFTTAGQRLIFASEIKAILADPSVPRAVDEESLFHYLTFLVAPAPRTLFTGIQKLEAGTWLRARSDGTIRQHRYWDVWNEVEPLVDLTEDEIAELVLAELRSPAGVFLSGGVDSSTNAALFSEGESSSVRTFSIGYAGDFKSYQNELGFAARMAAAIGADYHQRELTQDDLLNFLPRMVQLQDEPLGDPVCIPVYYVAELAKQNGVTVCHVGEGADELFCGYPGWRKRIRLQAMLGRDAFALLKRPLAAACRLDHRRFRALEFLRRATERQPVFWSGTEVFTDAQKSPLLSPRLRRELSGLSSWTPLEAPWARYKMGAWEQSSLNWMTYSDLTIRLPELLLMRVDKMTMAASVESRVPFLDHKLVALALSIPTTVKIGDGELKHILKKAVRGVIPDEIIDRPKQGFGVPVHEYFRDRFGEIARHELALFCRETDLFDLAGVQALLEKGSGANAWYLLNVALWWKEYIR